MGLRSNRRNLVVWSSSAGQADRDRTWRPTRTQRIRQLARISALFAILGVMRLAAGARRRKPLLVGTVLTVAGITLRSGPVGGVVLLPGLLLLVFAMFTPASPAGDRTRRSELERELAAYSTPAQRYDLEATLDRYSDDVTGELREIIAAQPMVPVRKFPVAGRY
jgi:hypothetical protein